MALDGLVFGVFIRAAGLVVKARSVMDLSSLEGGGFEGDFPGSRGVRLGRRFAL